MVVKKKDQLLEIKRAYLYQSSGNILLLFNNRNSSGQWSCNVSFIDIWGKGFSNCHGIKNVSEKETSEYLSSYRENFNFKEITWESALYLLKRGLNIRKVLDLSYPPGFYQFKDLFKSVDDIKTEGTVYKCRTCDRDLTDEEIELIKEIVIKVKMIDFLVVSEEYPINGFCEECKEKLGEEIEESGVPIKVEQSPMDIYLEALKFIEEEIQQKDGSIDKKVYVNLVDNGLTHDEAVNELALSLYQQTFDIINEDADEFHKLSNKIWKVEIDRTDRLLVFKVNRKSRKGLWRRFEIREDSTLGEFDRIIRESFYLDIYDHLSEFYPGKVWKSRGYGEIAPDGTGSGTNIRIYQLGLSEGDKIEYVYDFGDDIQYIINLEKITEIDSEAEYPLCIAKSKRRNRYCMDCKKKGKKKSIAKWICLECTQKEKKQVLLCEDCLMENHEDHYNDEYDYQ